MCRLLITRMSIAWLKRDFCLGREGQEKKRGERIGYPWQVQGVELFQPPFLFLFGTKRSHSIWYDAPLNIFYVRGFIRGGIVFMDGGFAWGWEGGGGCVKHAWLCSPLLQNGSIRELWHDILNQCFVYHLVESGGVFTARKVQLWMGEGHWKSLLLVHTSANGHSPNHRP